MILCWLAGALIAVASGRLPLRVQVSAKWACVAFGTVIIASLAVRLSVLAISIDHFPDRLVTFLASVYFREVASFPSVTAAALLLEGCLLYVLVCSATARHRASWKSALAMFAIGAIAAGTLNLVRFAEILLRATSPWTMLAQQIERPRLNVHYADVNAAGSYFSLGIFVTLGLARTRTTRLAAAGWYAGTAVLGMALWLTGSRAAVLATGLGALVWAMIELRGSTTTRMRVAAGVALAVGLSIAAAIQLRNPAKPAAQTLAYRLELARVGLRMLHARPAFGIGIGEFYGRSYDFASSDLRAAYPHENAHNNFLQIGAELGLVGLAAFVWLLIAGFRAARGWSDDCRAGRFVGPGLLFGVLTFLATCLAGHPLLTRDVAYAFWVALGLLLALDPAVAEQATGRRSTTPRRAALVLAIALAVSVPFRSSRERSHADLGNVALGVSDWYRDGSGSWIRDVTGPATFFVPSDVPAVVIPLQIVSPVSRPLFADIVFNGRHADRVRLNPGGWTQVRLLLPEHASSRFSRVELRILAGEELVQPRDAVVRMGRLAYP